MEKTKGVYKRSDGRWEARYKKGVGPDGRAKYGAVYGSSREEVMRKREEIAPENLPNLYPDQLNLLILGAGSHGRDVMEIAESLHIFNKIRFLDDNAEGENIIGKCSDAARLRSEYPCAFVAIGDNKKRKKLAAYLKMNHFLIPKLIAPTATISSNAVIGEGTVVMSQANLGSVRIGNNCIIAPSCTVSTDVEIEDNVRIDTGAIVARDSYIPSNTWVKSGEIYNKRRKTA